MNSSYDKTVGYSSLEDVDEEKMLQVIRVNKRIIGDYYFPSTDDLVLVAGAGQGLEAILVAVEYQLKTFGVDLNIAKLMMPADSRNIFLQRQDISALAFPDRTFSLIYCYHVLEHVNDHLATLNELRRVLRSSGVLFIGFPNRNRLFSYMGTSQKASFLDKIRWNFHDYKYRLMGKFENKHGAHAGFNEDEFISIAIKIFSAVYPVRDRYMLYKYSRHEKEVGFLIKTGLAEFLFPSNYFICLKD